MRADIVNGVMTYLKTVSTITAITTSTRIYRRRFPTGTTFPAITVSKVDDIRDDITNNGGYAHARIQITSWASLPGQEENLSSLVVDALHKMQNRTLQYTVASKPVQVWIISVKDAGGIPDEDSEIPIYMEHRDFDIHYDYR